MIKRIAPYCFLSIIVVFISLQSQAQDNMRTLIVFFDGLRPDYITQEGMPNLYAFKQRSSYGRQHHSVFPTVTRVNASSYSTGSYPGTHGLLGNSVYFPSVSKNSSLNTGEAEELNKIVDATQGKLLTAVSLGEILQSVGKKMMVFSSGSTGQAMMQNHTVSGGAVINPAMILPASIKEKVIQDIGPIPASGKPNTARHQWVTDALIKYGFADDGPLVNAIWYSDPDGTAHSDGIGSPTAIAAIKSVDEQFGRILAAIDKKGWANSVNIFISTDHGFVTHVGKEGLGEFLVKQGLKKDKDSDDVVLAGGAIYVKDHDKTIIAKIVAVLQAQEWVGAIFTRGKKAGDLKGVVDGTLSFETIHWNHERAADILVDVNWDDRKNSAGYEGTSYSRGVAGHGSLSPYEVHIPLIVSGPAFRKAFELDAPTSNVDIVPTILHLHGIAIPPSMDGRVIYEMLANPGGAVSPAAKKETITTKVKTEWGSYELHLELSIMGKYRYVNFAKVKRVFPAAPAARN
jgi:predicted AlkP superfamily pyrophosphatase or phosphodiesterase